MKKTNYEEIAARYDRNTYRHRIEPDPDLKIVRDSFKGKSFTFLDLGCGTGLYLEQQIRYYSSERIRWHGVDASEAMLGKARERVSVAELRRGVAESLPYGDNYFDFICTNNTFHHFEEKEKVIAEAFRVLKDEGVFKIQNISIHDMKEWWIYKFFPAAYIEDLKRFPTKELIYQKLIQQGFTVKLRMKYTREEVSLKEYEPYICNRDISVLTIIGNEEYQKGFDAIQRILVENPQATITADFAEVCFVARKN